MGFGRDSRRIGKANPSYESSLAVRMPSKDIKTYFLLPPPPRKTDIEMNSEHPSDPAPFAVDLCWPTLQVQNTRLTKTTGNDSVDKQAEPVYVYSSIQTLLLSYSQRGAAAPANLRTTDKPAH